MSKLLQIQQKLNAPKSLFNSFGNYHYRSAETILEAVKPLLAEAKCTLTLSDEVRDVGGWVFVTATASLYDENGAVLAAATASARHEEHKKGMDASQVSGACSSYARKYALNGLFLIDDAKDSDATNDHGKAAKYITAKQVETVEDALANGTRTPKQFLAKLQEHGIMNIREMPDGMYKAVVEWCKG